MELILSFLTAFNCFPTLNIVEDEKTFYQHGVVHISRPITDAKLVHELVHSCQEAVSGGPAQTHREWIERERHAKHIEIRWLEFKSTH